MACMGSLSPSMVGTLCGDAGPQPGQLLSKVGPEATSGPLSMESPDVAANQYKSSCCFL